MTYRGWTDDRNDAGDRALAALRAAEGRRPPKPSRRREARSMGTDRVERLGSVAVRGDLHAAYPTATHTLCGRRFDGKPDRRGPVPTCVECQLTAAVFDRIDRSAPATWRATWEDAA